MQNWRYYCLNNFFIPQKLIIKILYIVLQTKSLTKVNLEVVFYEEVSTIVVRHFNKVVFFGPDRCATNGCRGQDMEYRKTQNNIFDA